jgi:hypothetical protein
MDARTRNHRDFNSLVFICKHDGLEYLGQSRNWVFTHAEVRGKDNKKNIESDLLPALKEVQVRSVTLASPTPLLLFSCRSIFQQVPLYRSPVTCFFLVWLLNKLADKIMGKWKGGLTSLDDQRR